MATTTKAKGKSAPDAIMATSFIKPARLKKTGVKVLTTDNTIESYPACRMRELHNLAEMFGWVIMPMRLVSFDSIIKAYSSESVYYAWELYQACNRFKKSSSGNMRFYIIAPFSFLDTYSMMTNYSGLDDIIENAYFPQSLKEIQNSIRVLKPILMEAGSIINGMAQIIEDNRRRQQEEEDKKKDPCILAIDAKDDICDPKAVARIGLCWGPELPDFLVGDLPRNNGSFDTVTYPWSKDLVKNVGYGNLDSDHKIRDSYLNVKKAFNRLCENFEDACCWSRARGQVNKLANEWEAPHCIKTLIEAFPEKRTVLEEIQNHITTYFEINGDSRSCPGRYKELYPYSKCSDSTRREIRNTYGHWHKEWDDRTRRHVTIYNCRTECCYTKLVCAKKILELLHDFSRDFLNQYYVKNIKSCFKKQILYEEVVQRDGISVKVIHTLEHKPEEIMEFIPLIKVMEDDDSRRVKEIKEEFPEFWTFYELITK